MFISQTSSYFLKHLPELNHPELLGIPQMHQAFSHLCTVILDLQHPAQLIVISPSQTVVRIITSKVHDCWCMRGRTRHCVYH